MQDRLRVESEFLEEAQSPVGEPEAAVAVGGQDADESSVSRRAMPARPTVDERNPATLMPAAVEEIMVP
jgi:hypothetical protein